MQAFNARTQQLEDIKFSKVQNGEIVAEFKDGGFIKFPAGSTREQIEELIEAHRAANEGQEVITPEAEAAAAEADAATDELVDQLNADTTAESDKTHGSPSTGPTE